MYLNSPLRIFFTGIILGALFFLLFYNGNGPLIGSSAGTYALLFFMLCYMPNHLIKISFIKFFPFRGAGSFRLGFD